MQALSNSFSRVVKRYLTLLNSPRSLTVWLLIDHEEWGQLVSLSCDPLHYNDAESYLTASSATCLLKKFSGLPTGIDLPGEALKTFIIAEKQCYVTNHRLDPLLTNHTIPGVSDDAFLTDVLSGIQSDIYSLLGAIPEDMFVKHGPGATFSDRGKAVSAIHKMSNRPTMTFSFTDLLPLWEDTAWCRGLVESHPYRSWLLIVRGNRFISVPKDSTKNRGIAIEPSLNVAYQLCVGVHLKSRLTRWNIVLSSSTEGQYLHRRLACSASKQGHLATIDLTNASDTVSKNLVRLFMPDMWYSLLESLRSTTTVLPNGQVHFLEKFSSMGNGFTFELETIIFASIVRAVARQRGVSLDKTNFGVYGDDIICPIEIASDVLCLLKFFGFTPNDKKTFLTGSFRESCGGDFYDGFSVRSHYCKAEPAEPADWISLHNGILRVSDQLAELGSEISLGGALAEIASQLPSDIRRLKGPRELGDIVIHNDDPKTWVMKHAFSRRWVRTLSPWGRVFSYRDFEPGPLLAAALYGMLSKGYTLRSDIQGYSIKWVGFS